MHTSRKATGSRETERCHSRAASTYAQCTVRRYKVCHEAIKVWYARVREHPQGRRPWDEGMWRSIDWAERWTAQWPGATFRASQFGSDIWPELLRLSSACRSDLHTRIDPIGSDGEGRIRILGTDERQAVRPWKLRSGVVEVDPSPTAQSCGVGADPTSVGLGACP